jgi:L-lactate dehydrogenase complex protein LldE
LGAQRVRGDLLDTLVSLFITCFNDTLFPETGRATVAVLERLGHEVEFRDEQTCCGQMHANAGYPEEGRALAARTARVLAGAEAVVTPSASCAGHLREHVPGLPVYELSDFLTGRLGVTDVGARYPHTVCDHPTCHSLRGLRLGERPLELLRAVRELEVADLAGADECCGFGGTFAIKNAAVSQAMLADKLDRIEASGADAVTAVDNSCLMQIGGGLRRRGSAVRAVHLAEILATT